MGHEWEDIAICATKVLGLLIEVNVLGDFLKNFPWSPLCTFPENTGLGDLAKIAITWPFGNFWSRFLHQNHLQSSHFNWI